MSERLPNPSKDDEVSAYLNKRCSEMYELLTGQPAPNMGSILTAQHGRKPQLNLQPLITMLATLELQLRYVQTSLNNAAQAHNALRKELRGIQQLLYKGEEAKTH